MFDFGNMPLHPLVIHAVVAGIPLSALLAVLFAIPRTRRWARWPLAFVPVVVTAVTYVAKETGRTLESLQQITPDTLAGDLIAEHERLADQLFLIMLGFTVVALVNVFVFTSTRTGPMSLILRLLLVAAAIVATVWVVRVGDVGARAVWNPTDQPLVISAGR